MAQRCNVEKRDAWPGNDAFVPNVQPVAARAGTGSQDLCVSAPAMSTGSHGDVLDKTAQVHPERCNPNQKLTEHAQTHPTCYRVRALMKTHRGEIQASEQWWLLFSPSQCSQAGYAPLNSWGQREYVV